MPALAEACVGEWVLSVAWLPRTYKFLAVPSCPWWDVPCLWEVCDALHLLYGKVGFYLCVSTNFCRRLLPAVGNQVQFHFCIEWNPVSIWWGCLQLSQALTMSSSSVLLSGICEKHLWSPVSAAASSTCPVSVDVWRRFSNVVSWIMSSFCWWLFYCC